MQKSVKKQHQNAQFLNWFIPYARES